MKSARVRAMASFVLLVAVLSLVGCGLLQPSSQEDAPDEQPKAAPTVSEGLKQQGFLTVGIRSDASAPFLSTTSGRARGLDVDLACSLADQMGLKVALVYVDDVDTALAQTCDLVMSVPANEHGDYVLLGNYAQSATALFHLGQPTVIAAQDLTDKTIALQDGSPSQMTLRTTTLAVNAQPVDNLAAAFDEVECGMADYAMCQATVGAYMASWHDGVTFAGAFSEPVPACIALVNGDGPVQTAVREAYDTLSSNGVLNEVRRSWLGDMPTLDSSSIVTDIPLRETSGVSIDALASESDSLSLALDGSTAGSNAVMMGS